jgi:hypothetical protein
MPTHLCKPPCFLNCGRWLEDLWATEKIYIVVVGRTPGV